MGIVRLLDCTLRDGGHVVQGKFGSNVISATITALVDAKIDIIEAGFLWETTTDEDTARFYNIAELKKILPENMGNSKLSLMADNVDLSHLEPYDGTVEYIRLSFRKNEFEWAEKTIKQLKEKGYKCYINPIHGSAISDEEYIDIIQRVNRMKPYAFSIVDTFGAMRQSDLGRIYYLVENNLDKEIALGIHLHENLGLAFSLAQYILSIVSPLRNITIDGALYGMGKIPGNLCVEQMMDYLNTRYGTSYSTEPVYDAIDDFIMPIYENQRWGYSVPYALSAQCGVHRTYSEYLIAKNRLHTKDIRRLLKTIGKENAEIFNKSFIEDQYQKYMLADYDDRQSVEKLESVIEKYNHFLIIAPGYSIYDFNFPDVIIHDSCIITVNFKFNKVHEDYLFFSNTKRLNYANVKDMKRMLITSNLIDDIPDAGFVFSRNELAYHDDIFCDDSTLMLLNCLKRCKRRNIFLAGFDGFDPNHRNFYDSKLERNPNQDDYDQVLRKKILRNSYSDMNINFITPSYYQNY
ncbi:MAG: aldolase catalytic domain-containing protein [Lachnospiraceae bacterium]|nr:aldolase catalytic domain-containing protein [Lachnospiraceae bacterium]